MRQNTWVVSLRSRPQLTRIVTTLLLACAGSAARAQSRLLEFRGSAFDYLGAATDFAGDVDRDGYLDILVSAPSRYVSVYSGRSGARILHVADNSFLFGLSIAGIGDADRDGHDDVAVIHPFLRVYSGRTGKMLWRTVTNPDAQSRVVAIGDVNGDKHADIALMLATSIVAFSGRDGTPLYRISGMANINAIASVRDFDRDGVRDLAASVLPMQATRQVRIFSGKNGSLLRTVPVSRASAIADVGDVDRDGLADIAISDRSWQNGSGEVNILSGRDLLPIHRWQGTKRNELFGFSVSGAGDVDGDGRADVWIGATEQEQPTPSGRVVLYSGTGNILFTLRAGPRQSGFGAHVCGGKDVNGDGIPDALTPAYADYTTHALGGSVRLWSSRSLALTSDAHELSLRAPRTAKFELSSPARPQHPYLLLGTLSGTKPGIRFGSVTLPLNPDPYWTLTLGLGNQWITGSAGILDKNGQANAALILPPGLPTALAATQLDHAYLVFDRSSNPVSASNSVPLRLAK